MALKITTTAREFLFDSIRLPDPDPSMSLDQVRQVYAAQYPAITTATLQGPEIVGTTQRYTFSRSIGTKG